MGPSIQKKADDFQALLLSLQDKLGVVVGDDKYLEITDKLDPVMTIHGIESLDVLAKRLLDDDAAELRTSVLQEITSPNSAWFGQPEISPLLTDYILPGMMNQGVSNYRIWVVGCGSGQLTYSIAMLIDNYKRQCGLSTQVDIVASDLADDVVRRASKGRFSPAALEGLPEFYRTRYLKEDVGQYEVDEAIRSMIQFKTCNLVENFDEMGHCDLIICSDVLIYFSNSVKAGLLNGFADRLDRSGVLIVGYNEPVTNFCDRFERVDHESGVFYRQLPEA